MRRSGVITTCVLAAALHSGCVTVEERSAGAVKTFEWGDDLETIHDVGVHHGTQLYLEIDPPKEIPGGMEYLRFVLPRRDGNREVYSYFGVHQIVYSQGRWEVGPDTYTAGKGKSRLFVFKEREGDFEFKFKQQSIRVESDRKWKPSVYHLRQDAWEKVSRSARRTWLWGREVLQIGRAKIEVDSRQPGIWLVNGVPYKPLSERVLKLRGMVRRQET